MRFTLFGTIHVLAENKHRDLPCRPKLIHEEAMDTSEECTGPNLGSDSTDLHAFVKEKLDLHKKDATLIPARLQLRVTGIQQTLRDEDVKLYMSNLVSPSHLAPARGGHFRRRERARSDGLLPLVQQLTGETSDVADSTRGRGSSVPQVPRGSTMDKRATMDGHGFLVGRSTSAPNVLSKVDPKIFKKKRITGDGTGGSAAASPKSSSPRGSGGAPATSEL